MNRYRDLRLWRVSLSGKAESLPRRRGLSASGRSEAPIECKDLLKERGYRWNGGEDGRPRAWYCDLDRDLLVEEEQFLAEKIYKGGHRRHELIRIDYSNRFSDRV